MRTISTVDVLWTKVFCWTTFVLTPYFTNSIKLSCDINQGCCQHAKKHWASGLLLQKGCWVPYEVLEHGLTRRQQQWQQWQLQRHKVTIIQPAKDKRHQLMTGGCQEVNTTRGPAHDGRWRQWEEDALVTAMATAMASVKATAMVKVVGTFGTENWRESLISLKSRVR